MELGPFSLKDFQHPAWLLGLVVPVALIAGYVVVMLFRRRRTIRFGNLDLLDKVGHSSTERLRHLPAALLSIALAALVLALAAPMQYQKVPRNRATVVLVVDVSMSMRATDVAPNRLEAAQAAATDFINSLPEGINLGVIAFSGTATPLLSPTSEREPARNAIANLQLSERTATGEAIFSSLQMISTFGEAVQSADGPPPAHIILLSDGKQTVPRAEDDARGGFTAADAAKSAGVPVSTISFGTRGGFVEIEGTRIPVPVDDASLEEIARRAGGSFFTASSREQLAGVYTTLEEQIGYEYKLDDASRPWLILGAGLLVSASVGSLTLNRRLP